MTTTPPSGWPSCYLFVYWWDGEYEGNCELRKGHPPNFHYEGVSWFDDNSDPADYAVTDEIAAYIRYVYGPPKGLLVL